MAQFRSGIVSTTEDSNVVTGYADTNGNTTQWLSTVNPGDIIRINTDNFFYTIASVVSNTELTLTANYHSTTSGVAYEVTRDFTPNNGLPLPYSGDVRIADLIRKALTMIDEALLTAGKTICLTVNFFGTQNVTTASGNEIKLMIPGLSGAPCTVASAQIIHADNYDADGDTKVKVSLGGVGVSASNFEATVLSASKQGAVANGPISTTAGSNLYVFVSSAHSHQNLQVLITINFN